MLGFSGLPPPHLSVTMSPLFTCHHCLWCAGVGYKTEQILTRMGVTTVQQLRHAPLKSLVDTLGQILGTALYWNARCDLL